MATKRFGRAGRRHGVKNARRCGRPDARQKLQHAETGDAVARIFGKAQAREHVLHMRGIEEFQPAEFHERNVAAGQLDFERGAVMRRAEQHRLLLQHNATLAILQNALHRVTRLIGFVAHRDKLRPLRRHSVRPEVLGKSLGCEADHGVRGCQYRLRRAIVALQRHDPRRRRELPRKVEDVAHGGGAKRVDRLRVVADHGEAAAVGLEPKQDCGLQPVRVLVLVDQHVLEAGAHIGGERRLRHHLRPVEQQVVVIEHVLALLGFDIGGKQLAQLALDAAAPGKRLAEHGGEFGLRIHGARVDRKAGAFGRKAVLRLREAELVPHEVHQVGGVLAVVDRERRRKADLLGVLAQKPRPDAVERARPGERGIGERGVRAGNHRHDTADAAAHLGGGAARERQQQNAARIGAVDDQMSDAMRQRVGLARAGAGNDKQRPAACRPASATPCSTALRWSGLSVSR